MYLIDDIYKYIAGLFNSVEQPKKRPNKLYNTTFSNNTNRNLFLVFIVVIEQHSVLLNKKIISLFEQK